jgi:hypothetical protein
MRTDGQMDRHYEAILVYKSQQDAHVTESTNETTKSLPNTG